MYGLENRFKMQVLLGLKRAHCEMGIQQPRTTSEKRERGRREREPERVVGDDCGVLLLRMFWVKKM